ncbi:hypothetical protein BU25DRAFT_453439 [Macroventuria anomochaeta]|uniref:Uncharacterized protein n=1 Tax=Macroventuria anomochaeta TaxID=301207 RepID=A0ACB6SJA2_9PLEO|nr:uncharacterized protein BU25DRAFT_453439 [Macroventuria anomochaeta]KAF2633702.1 hypothetical protein BU25DRAFT_453439 [Macroventuria anomochaeta]
MDHYPEVNVGVQEHPSSASRHDSASSVTKASDFHSPPSLVPSRQPSHTMPSTAAPSNTSAQQKPTSNPPTSDATEPQEQERKDSIHTDEQTAEKLKAELARYTDAPPPFSEEQYENKTEEQQLSMRTQDYAKELSRMMGRQLITTSTLANLRSATSGQNISNTLTTMDSQSSSASSSPTSSPTSQAFSAFPFPPVPDHIIVTFDGKVREMVRITKDPVEARESRPKPKRYYSQDN